MSHSARENAATPRWSVRLYLSADKKVRGSCLSAAQAVKADIEAMILG